MLDGVLIAMDEIRSALRSAGLTEGESNVYLALVHLGSTTVGPIIDQARISSSKVYIILDKLIHKGLATYVVNEKTKYFQAAQPVALLAYLNDQEKEFRKTREAISDIIPKIRVLQSQNPREESRIFKGYEGVRTGFLEAIESIPDTGEYCFFSTGYGDDPQLKRFFAKIVLQLKRRRIKVLGIASMAERALFEKYYTTQLGYRMRYAPHFWPADITIAGEYVLTLIWRENEPLLYAVRSKQFVESYRTFFHNTWKDANA
jgi:sugar-specific transcriptional regulator TrmB